MRSRSTFSPTRLRRLPTTACFAGSISAVAYETPTTSGANDVSAMPPPLLDRMLVVEVPWPDRYGARIVAEAIAAAVIGRGGLGLVVDGALEPLLHLSPRRIRRVLELASGFAAAGRRFAVTREDVRHTMDLVVRNHRRPAGFLADTAGGAR